MQIPPGLSVDELPTEIRRQYDIPLQKTAFLVTQVSPDSEAGSWGFQKNDVILQLPDKGDSTFYSVLVYQGALKLVYVWRREKAAASPSGPANEHGAASANQTELEADQKLNTAYRALRRTLSLAEKGKLRREEIEWIKRKDSIADPAARSKFIQQRTADLEQRTPR